jgi:hypothetical protein
VHNPGHIGIGEFDASDCLELVSHARTLVSAAALDEHYEPGGDLSQDLRI